MSYLLAKRETNLIEIILLVLAFVLHYYDYYSDVWWLLVERTLKSPATFSICSPIPTTLLSVISILPHISSSSNLNSSVLAQFQVHLLLLAQFLSSCSISFFPNSISHSLSCSLCGLPAQLYFYNLEVF